MRTNVAVIFGGKSVEHEISIISAVEAMGYLNPDKYNVIPIYIDKDNTWYTGFHLKDIINYRDIALVKRYAKRVALVKDHESFILQTLGFLKKNLYVIDLVIPIGHGAYLEDGSLQGYLNMIGVPYVGSGVLASSLGMDKVIMKDLLSFHNIPVTPYVWFYDHEFNGNKKTVLERINELHYPLYVKPANLGSSIGITCVLKEEELVPAIKKALKYSNKIIVEEKVKNVKEVNVSVLGNYERFETSDIEEINTNDEFFSFKEKYVEGYHKTVKKGRKANPLLSKEMKDDILKYASDTFNIINATGVARIDFLIDEKNRKIYVSEINTMPGSLSSYLWIPKKKDESELLEDLIKLAIKEKNREKELVTSFKNNLLESFDTLKGNKTNKTKK